MVEGVSTIAKLILWTPPFVVLFLFLAYFLFKKNPKKGLAQQEIIQRQANKKLHVVIVAIVIVIWMIMGYHLFK